MHTMNTVRLRVHIAPVGFEIDRIIVPAINMRADKVWLIAHANLSEDKARPFLEKIRKLTPIQSLKQQNRYSSFHKKNDYKIEKLKIFPDELVKRQSIAWRYSSLLAEVCEVPTIMPDHTSAWAQYTLILKDRENMQSRLNAAGIPSVVYYPIPLSRQLGYQKFPCVSTEVNTSEQLSKKVLSLPMHPYLTDDEITKVNNIIMLSV